MPPSCDITLHETSESPNSKSSCLILKLHNNYKTFYYELNSVVLKTINSKNNNNNFL